MRWPSTTLATGWTLRIYRGRDSLVRSSVVQSTSFRVRNLAPNTPYRFEVITHYVGGGRSWPGTGDGSTLPDTTPPTAPQLLLCERTSRTNVRITFRPSTDDVQVFRYLVKRLQSGSWVANSEVGANGQTQLNVRTSTSGAYTYRLHARDRVGNVSTPSNRINCPARS